MTKQNLKNWHKSVCDRAHYFCEVCGRRGDEFTLCGHHLLTRSSHPELAQDIDNGICVCNMINGKKGAGCHDQIHRGLIKLSPKRFEKIKSKLL